MSDTMTEPGGGPTWAGPPNPLDGLRRSEDDRWVAGVAGGIARHFRISSWIVRLVAVGLGIIGIGVPLYILAWLLLPTDSRPAVATERGWNRNTVIAVCVLVVVASIVILGSDGVSPPWRALPWIAIGVGAFLLIHSATTNQSPTSAPVPPTAPGEPIPTPPVPASAAPIAASAVTSQMTAVAEPTTELPGLTPPPTPPPPPRPPVPHSPPSRPAQPAKKRTASFLTPLVIFGLLGLVGAAVICGGRGWARPGVVAAIALAVIGVALVLSAFLGRARGLIPLGFLVGAFLLVGVSLGPHWDEWNNRTFAPASASQLHRTYERGVGRTVLDLRDVTLSSHQATRVNVDQAAGQVVVWLPDNTVTTLDNHVSVGAVDYDPTGVIGDEDHEGGTGVRSDRTFTTGDGSGRLDLHIDLGAGEINIHNGDAKPGGTR